MKQASADFLFKKTSRLGGFARKAFAKIRVYSWFLFFNFAAWRLRAKKNVPATEAAGTQNNSH